MTANDPKQSSCRGAAAIAATDPNRPLVRHDLRTVGLYNQ
jgi:hypothetical protein